jgi:hypothetical protein
VSRSRGLRSRNARRRRRRPALTRVGTELAEQAHPTAVTPEQAGAGVRGNLQTFTKDLNAQATAAYDRLREIEAQPEHARTIRTAPEGSPKYQQILGKLSKGWRADGTPIDAGTAEGGRVAVKPTPRELQVMRQIETELDAQPYQRGKLVQEDSIRPLRHWARGSANADVYHDLHSAMGYGDTLKGPSGAEMRADIRQTLESGDWNAASKAAYRVAQQRLRSNGSLTGPTLPAGTPILGSTETVQLPVDLRAAKQALRPLYDRLKREADLIPLQGDKGRALVALDRLINGRDLESLSVVDAALGDLKSMARADIPELRTQGQGLAAHAVNQLDAAVRRTAERAGPEALRALESGRASTVAKYQVGETLEDLNPEAVRVYKSLVANGDAEIGRLRKVAANAPEEVPKIGRAYLQDLLERATERGRFEHVDKLYADWQRLGDATKEILFPDAGHRQALDSFFLLAKRLGENPNPSGTAPTLLEAN